MSQNVHSLSFNGVFGLVYRQVSTEIGRLHERNLKRMWRWSLDKGKERYHSQLKYSYTLRMSLNFQNRLIVHSSFHNLYLKASMTVPIGKCISWIKSDTFRLLESFTTLATSTISFRPVMYTFQNSIKDELSSNKHFIFLWVWCIH